MKQPDLFIASHMTKVSKWHCHLERSERSPWTGGNSC